ncbi:MAG: nucleotidyl transferase AbiEii/AbiGii toxin family protein [Candidatus Margulisbacteria bacterium]|nr:nucleotidyl transferase AbiEii/AbiGii toxin family protein [Candidatus Margulisiibacteriota bacterium]
MASISPRFDTLPDDQQKLFYELKQVPSDFVLYDGTAIALRIGHRESIDFDFFSKQPFNPDTLYNEISFLKDSKIIGKSKDTLTCDVKKSDYANGVKISFFGGLHLRQIVTPDHFPENNIKIASLKDLLGMKCATIQNRSQKKDYIDIHAILKHTDLSLYDGLAAAQTIYGEGFNPIITLKALVFFDDGDLSDLSEKIKQDMNKEVSSVVMSKIPVLDPSKTKDIGDTDQGLGK